jgi:hypothetical protein
MLMLSLGSPLHGEKPVPLAQLAEQLTLNQWVPGSSPGGCTTVAGQKAILPLDGVALGGRDDDFVMMDRTWAWTAAGHSVMTWSWFPWRAQRTLLLRGHGRRHFDEPKT